MTHVYARETRGSVGGTEPGQVKIVILDRAAPGRVAASQQAYIEAARAGQVQGVMLSLEPEDQVRLALFVPGAYDSTSVPDVFAQVELTDLVREGGWVSGRLRTTEPREFMADGVGPQTPTSYTLDLRFRAPIEPAPRPTETLTGEAARRSPAVAAAMRELNLIRTGTLAEVRASFHPDHPVSEALADDRAAEILPMVREMLPEPAVFVQRIERVIVYGDEAFIVTRDQEGALTVSLRRVEGEWKIAPMPIAND
jgi:hypothetical protein